MRLNDSRSGADRSASHEPPAEPDSDLVALSDAAWHGVEREIVTRAGGTAEEIDGLLFTYSPHHAAPFIVNGAFRTDPTVPPAHAVANVRNYYAGRGRIAGIGTHAHDADLEEELRSTGWEQLVALAGMVALDPIARGTPAVDVELQRVDNPARLEQMVRVLGQSFGPEDPWPDVLRACFPDLSTVDPASTSAILATVAGKPAAAAVGYALEPVDVVGFVGTLSEFGRRGLGELVTRAVCAELREMTGRTVALQSSPMAMALYQRIGFRTVTTYGVWLDTATPTQSPVL
jgi:hypothetical protein